MKVALISLYDEFCIGLRYVAAHLTAQGHPATIITLKRYCRQEREKAPNDIGDGYLTQICPTGEVYLDYSSPITDEEYQAFFELLDKGGYALAGVSVPSYHAHVAAELTRAIHDRLGIPVIWGGVHATVATQDCLDRGAADFVCVGEGEDVALELVQALEAGTPKEELDIAGLCVRRTDGAYSKPRTRMPPHDLDAYPFPQYDPLNEHLIEDNRVYHNEPLVFSQLHWTYKMTTGRGCPYFCSFCVWSTIKREMPETKKLRRRSPANCIAELEQVVRRNPAVRMIEFEDDIFTVQKEWLEEFAPLYKERIGLPFWCYTYPNYVSDHNLLILKDMGITYITMGVQSGSDRINYEVFHRRTERQRVLAAMQLIAKHDILANYDIITNNPYETDEDRLATLTLLSQIPGRYNLHMGKLAWFPGTTITLRAQKENMLNAVDEGLYEFWNALYLMAQLRLASEEELVAMTQDTYLRENPQVLWTILSRFDDAAHLPYEVETLRGNLQKAQQENDRLRAELEGIKGRRIVRYGTGVVDGIKRITGSNRHPNGDAAHPALAAGKTQGA